MVKTQYVDSEILELYIKNSGMKLCHISDQLGISKQGFGKKRKGIIPFRAAEVYVLCDLLKIPESDKAKIFRMKVAE